MRPPLNPQARDFKVAVHISSLQHPNRFLGDFSLNDCENRELTALHVDPSHLGSSSCWKLFLTLKQKFASLSFPLPVCSLTGISQGCFQWVPYRDALQFLWREHQPLPERDHLHHNHPQGFSPLPMISAGRVFAQVCLCS